MLARYHSYFSDFLFSWSLLSAWVNNTWNQTSWLKVDLYSVCWWVSLGHTAVPYQTGDGLCISKKNILTTYMYIRACFNQPLIMIWSPRRSCLSFQRELGLSNATLMAVRACLSDYWQYLSVIWYACSIRAIQAASPVLWLWPGPHTACVYTVQRTDYTRPVLNYSGLFSTAMDGTALGVASDHNHWSWSLDGDAELPTITLWA